MFKAIIEKIKVIWAQSLVLENEQIKLLLVHRITSSAQPHWLPSLVFDIEEKHSGEIVGRCDLRFGMNPYMRYMGNIGYTIYPPFRGHYYAAQASALLLELAQDSMDEVIITCSPDNIASVKTIERLGAILLGVEVVPEGHELHVHGEGIKCIYKIQLQRKRKI